MRSVLLIVRSFARAKGFAAAAVLTVALGIGVNTIVFSLFDRVLFRPLPYAEPDRLVQVYSRIGHAGTPELPVPVTQALAREKGLVTGIAWDLCCDPQPLTPTSGENPLLWLRAVTTNTLDVLGVRPIIGAGFAAVRASRTEHPVLLTYDAWQHRYGGSSDVLSLEWMARDTWQRTGSDVHWRVVGVLPDGFLLPSSNLTPYEGLYGVEPDLDQTPQALRRRLAIVIVQPVLFGVLAGLPLSWMEVKLLSRSVPSVNAGDVQIYFAAAAAILIAALIAAWLPGRRFLTMRVAELLRPM
jgi:hypothetical protein